MDPVTTNQTVASPAPAQPVAAPSTPASVGGVPTPAVGASGPPAAAAPVAAPAVTQPVESPELARIRQERAEFEAQVARLMPWAQRGYQASLQQPASPAAPATPTPAAPKTNIFGVPELDPQVQQYLMQDAQGNVVATPDAPPGVIAAYRAHQQALGNALKKIATNPEEAFAPLIEKFKTTAVEQAKKDVLAEQEKARNAHVAEQIVERNGEWLFEKDPSGNRIIVHDPLTGQAHYKRTEGGEWWAKAADHLMKQGITDPTTVDTYARAYAFQQAWQKAEQLRQQEQAGAGGQQNGQVVQAVAQAPGASPPQIPIPDVRQAFLNRIPGALPGAHTPNGTRAVPDTRHLDIRQAMLQNLQAAGYAPGSRLPMPHAQAG